MQGEEQAVPADVARQEGPEAQGEAQRNLAGVLLGDVNQVAVMTTGAVTAAMAVKRVLGRGPGAKGGDGEGGGREPGAGGSPES
jgi:hypothetical protein